MEAELRKTQRQLSKVTQARDKLKLDLDQLVLEKQTLRQDLHNTKVANEVLLKAEEKERSHRSRQLETLQRKMNRTEAQLCMIKAELHTVNTQLRNNTQQNSDSIVRMGEMYLRSRSCQRQLRTQCERYRSFCLSLANSLKEQNQQLQHVLDAKSRPEDLSHCQEQLVSMLAKSSTLLYQNVILRLDALEQSGETDRTSAVKNRRQSL